MMGSRVKSSNGLRRSVRNFDMDSKNRAQNFGSFGGGFDHDTFGGSKGNFKNKNVSEQDDD